MPNRPAAPCSVASCPNKKPCPIHRVTRWIRNTTTTTTARGYGYAWEQIKRRILSRQTHCGLCGYSGRDTDMVDHIVPKVRGGSDDESNLQRVHRACHARKTGTEGALRRRVRA